MSKAAVRRAETTQRKRRQKSGQVQPELKRHPHRAGRSSLVWGVAVVCRYVRWVLDTGTWPGFGQKAPACRAACGRPCVTKGRPHSEERWHTGIGTGTAARECFGGRGTQRPGLDTDGDMERKRDRGRKRERHRDRDNNRHRGTGLLEYLGLHPSLGRNPPPPPKV